VFFVLDLVVLVGFGELLQTSNLTVGAVIVLAQRAEMGIKSFLVIS
jgi:hypothetical protein